MKKHPLEQTLTFRVWNRAESCGAVIAFGFAFGGIFLLMASIFCADRGDAQASHYLMGLAFFVPIIGMMAGAALSALAQQQIDNLWASRTKFI